MKVLIVVDYQNDFLPGGPLGVAGGDQLAVAINRIAQSIRRNAFTRDWHPADHCSFAKGAPEFRDGSWPVHCVRDTPGAQISSAIDPRYVTIIFNKGTAPDQEEYSAMRAAADRNDGRVGTLDNWLMEQEDLIDNPNEPLQVYVAGLATDYCVKATVLDLRRDCFETYVLTDAIAAVSEETGKAALKEMEDAGAILTTTLKALEYKK